MPGAPVPLITMSARASSSRSDSKGAARPPSAAASSSALLEGAAAQHRGPRAAAHQVPRRQLAHLARAHQEHVAVLQLAEDLAGQLHRHVGDRDRVLADAGLGARALGGGERAVAQRVQGGPEAPASSAIW